MGTRRIAAAAIACLALLSSLALPATSSADEAAWMYDPDAVVEINLGGLSKAELDELEAKPDDYVEGTFALKVDGEAKGSTLDVGIRLKGGLGSFKPLTAKAAFKVKFDKFVKDQLFFGVENLTLNNMVQDPSMLHETLTYELFGAMGLPASRTGYAFVRLNNGAVYGLYLNLETLDEHSLPRWFATTQHLYEADAPGTDVEPADVEKFEVDRGDEEDLGDLEALVAAANDEDGDWSDGMDAVADLEQMTRQWAVERYVAHWDGYAGYPDPAVKPNNYYLHSDGSGIFQMLPWGTDQTWDELMEFDEPAGGLMFNHCLADTSCKGLYEEALEDVYDVVTGGSLSLGTHAAELAGLLAPCQVLEEEPRREYSAAEIETGVEAVQDYIADRPEELADYLGLTHEPFAEPSPRALDEEPCSPDPDPKDTEPAVPSVVSPPQAGGLRIGRSRVRGSVVWTPVFPPTAGLAVQRVTTRIDGDRVHACTGQRRVPQAGRLTVSCRLSEHIRELRQSRSLRLKIWIGFASQPGSPEFDVRRLSLPKRP